MTLSLSLTLPIYIYIYMCVCVCVCVCRCIYIYIYIYIYTNPSARAGYDTRSIFKRSLTGFNSEFSFSLTSCLTKAEETSLPYYLPITGGRLIGFLPFPRVLVLCEMQYIFDEIYIKRNIYPC